MAKTTIALVKAEGNFYKEQFDVAAEQDLDDIVQQRIDEASTEVEQEVGSDNYNSSDPRVVSLLTTAETYLTCAKLFQTIEAVVATWDREQLPSEFINPDHIASIIARYRKQADAILDHFDVTFNESHKPYFSAS